MRRSRITITLEQTILEQVDSLIDKEKIRNRSHAIEYVLSRSLDNKINRAVILAGGQGTKLRPFTYEMPKALLPVKGKPLLEYSINNLRKNNIGELIVCVGHLGNKIIDYFGTGSKLGVKIDYYQEKYPMQTGGALKKIQSKLNNLPFFLIYGDILTDLPIRDLVSFHNEQKTIATIALASVNKPNHFGQFKLHGTKLVNFFQKNTKTIKSHLINCGIYILSPEIFNYFPKNKESFLIEDVIERLIKEKKASGFVFEGQWFDVGTPINYEKAIKEFKIKN